MPRKKNLREWLHARADSAPLAQGTLSRGWHAWAKRRPRTLEGRRDGQEERSPTLRKSELGATVIRAGKGRSGIKAGAGAKRRPSACLAMLAFFSKAA